jgi:uncharacterized protein
MLAKLNDLEIEELLRQQIVGRIGCHADGVTYVVPISYGYDGQYIYSRTDEGMKLEMMRKNPVVCFQVDHFHNMANWKSVIVMGKFEEITATAARNAALEVLGKRIFPLITSETVQQFANYPYQPMNFDEIKGTVFRIVPQKKSGRCENNGFFPTAPF